MKGMLIGISILFFSYFVIYFSADIGKESLEPSYKTLHSFPIKVDSVAEEQDNSDIGLNSSKLKTINISTLSNEILRQELPTKLTNTKIISATIEKIESKKNERSYKTVLEVSYKILGPEKNESVYKFTSCSYADNLMSGMKRRFFSSREKAFKDNVSKLHSFLVSFEGIRKQPAILNTKQTKFLSILNKKED